jgi:glycerol uptake facilitator-like aquaporin
MTVALWRRLAAEFTGTGLMVAVVLGSGIAATILTSDAALQTVISRAPACPEPAGAGAAA